MHAMLTRLREDERGRFILWLPVLMGTGVLAYFALRQEPPFWLGLALLAPSTLAAFLLPAGSLSRATATATAAIALGFASAQFATWRAPPIQPLPTSETTLMGVVRGVDLLPGGGRRLLIEGVRLDGAATPLARPVRVRLRANDPLSVTTGDIVRVRALVRPAAPPPYPGGHDLQRDSFYAGLGGSGFALGSAELVAPGDPSGLAPRMERLREMVGDRFRAGIPGPAGTIAATLFTGMAGAIPETDHAAFRDSGLAHLLAVAGLHIGIVMGWVMFVARIGLALSEYVTLRWPTKQFAALAALAAGGGYMALTGMHVPIMRSFSMAVLYTLAVVLGRHAISLRGLALAAAVLILLTPQELPGVSFQMSFAAVLALIAGYDALRPHLAALHGAGGWHRHLLLHATMLGLTSLLAGTASAPFGAYHFGHVQVYFILANMLAVPLTALWVMPLGLVSLLLMPLGIEHASLLPMGWGVEAILVIARTTAALPDAVVAVPHAPAWGLGLVAFGMTWLGLWRSRIRLAGTLVLAVGLASPWMDRPADLLISADARLIAVRTQAGIFIAQASGASRFTRDDWTDYWADGPPRPMPQTGVVADGAVVCEIQGCFLRPNPAARPAFLVRGGVSAAACREALVMLATEPARGLCPRPWPLLVDRFTVWHQGAVAIWLTQSGARIVSDQTWRGVRPWIPVAVHRAAATSQALPMAAHGE
jgi:competence protein ComEC